MLGKEEEDEETSNKEEAGEVSEEDQEEVSMKEIEAFHLKAKEETIILMIELKMKMYTNKHHSEVEEIEEVEEEDSDSINRCRFIS